MRKEALEVGRRDFTKGMALLGASFYDHPVQTTATILRSAERREIPQIVLDKQGFHSPPEQGGGAYPEWTILYTKNTGGSSLVVLSPKPDDQIVTKANEAGLLVISRGSNAYNPQEIDNMLSSYPSNAQKIVQIGNELNLATEKVNGVAVTKRNLREYVYKHYMPAALQVAEADGTILLPPTAQTGNLIEEFFYREAFLSHLREHPSFSKVQPALADSVHAYVIQPGMNEPIFKRVQYLNQSAQQILGQHLPLYITEMGIQQSPETIGKYPPSLICKEIMRLLQTPLPNGMDIRSINWWLLANSNFRKEKILPEHEIWMKVYDESAWVKNLYEVNPWYTQTVELFEQRKKDRLDPGDY